ncbi:hypothetical protein [Spirosoma sp.]|uniref:hypothetical protein n=1 Tax=Spirosoma sp. TaxID=1899569 RepID=UPI002627165A|nr:hypothetical protein [Spirosoma sp.]MCX6213738.1 hypothetical protein [Spirosoma sp.]
MQPVLTPAPQKQNGIRAQIYRNYGPNEQHLLGHVDSVVIVGEGITGNAFVSERCPAVYLEPSALGEEYAPHLRPVGHEKKQLMASGDLVYSDQPDFAAHFKGFLKLHDRYEGR